MTFQSVKVYLLEISAPLLMHSNKTEKARPRVYFLIPGQQHAVCKNMVSPRLGTQKDPICQFMHYCISPPPETRLHETRPPSLFIKNVIMLLFAHVKTNKIRFGG